MSLLTVRCLVNFSLKNILLVKGLLCLSYVYIESLGRSGAWFVKVNSTLPCRCSKSFDAIQCTTSPSTLFSVQPVFPHSPVYDQGFHTIQSAGLGYRLWSQILFPFTRSVGLCGRSASCPHLSYCSSRQTPCADLLFCSLCGHQPRDKTNFSKHFGKDEDLQGESSPCT